MKAVVYESFGGPLRVENVADPAPAADGVVVEVHATGLCRSDWHGWQGHDPDIRAFPHVPGHELAGVVREIGRDVRRWKPGDRVTMPFVAGCGSCVECRGHNPQVCDAQFQPGFTGWGSFAETVALRYADYNLVALPGDMDFAAAASLGCRVGTAYRAVVEVGRLQAGQWLAVHGCGGLGLAAVMIAAASGARVIGVDIDAEALALASAFGAEATVDADLVDDVPLAIRAVAPGGVDLSIDALGSVPTAANSIRCLRKRGRHVQVGLLAGSEALAPLPMDRVIAYELELLGSHGVAATSYAPLLELAMGGAIDIARLVQRTIPLAEAPAALAAMGTVFHRGVVIIDPQAPAASPSVGGVGGRDCDEP